MEKAGYIQKGETIDYANNGASEIGYNDVVPLVTKIAIAAEKIPVGATGGLRVVGIYELPAVNDTAFVVGDQLYWDNIAGKLTKISAGNIACGWCAEPKAQAGTLARVKIG